MAWSPQARLVHLLPWITLEAGDLGNDLLLGLWTALAHHCAREWGVEAAVCSQVGGLAAAIWKWHLQ